MSYFESIMTEKIKESSLSEKMSGEEISNAVSGIWNAAGNAAVIGIGDTTSKDIYRMLIIQAQRSCTLLGRINAPSAFIAPTAKRKLYRSLVFPLLCLLLAGITFRYYLGQDISVCIIAGAEAALVTAWAAKMIPMFAALEKDALYTENSFDTEAIKKELIALAAEIDFSARAALETLEMNSGAGTASMSTDGLSLAIDIMKLYPNPKVEVPEAVRTAVGNYLSVNGIRTVGYSAENADMFRLYPSDGELTLLPALLRGDELIRRGEACCRS